MVWCPLTCPTNNAKQRSCNRVYAGFRWCTKERILIIYSDTSAKVVFFLLSFQPASNALFLCPVRSGSSRPPYRRGVPSALPGTGSGVPLPQTRGDSRKNTSVLLNSLTALLLFNICSINSISGGVRVVSYSHRSHLSSFVVLLNMLLYVSRLNFKKPPKNVCLISSLKHLGEQ